MNKYFKTLLASKKVIVIFFLLVATHTSGQLINYPTDITGIQLWLDAADPNGNGSVPMDGASINVWQDKSGNNNDATVLSGQGSASFRSLGALQINGNPVMEFTSINDNSGDVYDVSGLDIRPVSNPDITVFVVYRQKNVNNAVNAIWGVDNGAWDRFFYLRHSAFGDTVNDGIVGLGPSDQAAIVLDAAIENKTQLLSVVYDGNVVGGTNNGPVGASLVRFGSTLVTNFTDTSEASNQRGSLNIGWDGDSGAGDFYLAEFIVYNRLLTTCETSQVIDYLSIKYGESFSQTITSQPQDLGICTPDNAVFTVETTGTGLTYQWQEDDGGGSFINMSDDGVISGSITKQLTLTSPNTTYSQRKYRVLVTRPDGCISTSRDANLIIGPTDPIVSLNTTQDFCDIENATVGDIVISGTNIKWYNAVSGGIPLSPLDTLISGIYYATQTINSCESFPRLAINVNVFKTVVPLSSSNIPTLEACDSNIGGSDTNGITSFDLTNHEAILLNGENPTEFAFTYFTDAVYSTPISTPDTAFENTLIGRQTIYARMSNVLGTMCYTDVNFDIVVYALPTINSAVELKQCDDDTDGISLFNLSEVNSLISTNSGNETVTYYLTDVLAQSGLVSDQIVNYTAYPNPSPLNSVVFARVENVTNCYRTSRIDLLVGVSQIPPTFNTLVYTVCDDELIDGDKRNGIATFDFSDATAIIENLFPLPRNFQITYYNNEADALAEQNVITDISNHRNIEYPNSQDIYVRIDSDVVNACLGLGNHITLNVETLPIANPVIFSRQCDDVPIDTEITSEFDTSNLEIDIFQGQANVNLAYFKSDGSPLTDASGTLITSPFPNSFRTASQVITVKATNATTNTDNNTRCDDEITIAFIVDQTPIANRIVIAPVCDDGVDDTDGFHEFDTSNIQATLLGSQTGMIVSYFDGNNDTLPSPLPNPFNSATQTITVTIENPINTTCIATTTFDLIVNPLPAFTVDTPRIICESGPASTITLDVYQDHSVEVLDYSWADENGNFISNSQSIDVTASGTYFVSLTKTDGTNCSRTREIFVVYSEKATITMDAITIVDDSNNNTITINNENNNLGQGDYEFSLDDDFVGYQNEPYFDYVEAGIHTIYIRDKNGCGITAIEVSVIGFPKFFTPNNDGSNDTWQVKGLSVNFHKSSIIRIFDRFGKIIAKVDGSTNGWNGIYNGQELPSTDYWFTLQLTEVDGTVRNRKGHFSMIRR